MQRARSCFQFVLLLFSLVTALPSAVAQVVIATVPAGTVPIGVAVNSVTNKTYVANVCGSDVTCSSSSPGTVTVIDGATNNVAATVTVGASPFALAVNSKTNKVYVANSSCQSLPCSAGTVTVIDGASNTNTATITVGNSPENVEVNSMTNQIYVVNSCGTDNTCSSPGTVTVIDGATNNVVTTVAVGVSPYFAAVNSTTNQIYVVNSCGNDVNCQSPGTVTVIDGATNNVVTTVAVGASPYFAAVNSTTNQIYVPNYGDGTVTVIDGNNSNKVVNTVTVGVKPDAVAVNPKTNQIYVENDCGNDLNCLSVGTVTVIDGATNKTATVTVGSTPYLLAVDAVSNKTYVPNFGDGTVTVIDGVTNNTVTVTVGKGPESVAVNATIHRIYVPNSEDGTVSVIAGDQVPKLQFVAVTPCRLVDTRQSGGSGPIQGGTFQTFDLRQLAQSGDCADLSSAAAYSLNVTAVPPGKKPLGYLTIWPAGQPQPLVSTLNSIDGRVKANAAIVPAGASGTVSVFASNTTDVVLDIDGYFAEASNSTLAFYPLPPCRVADTRNPNGWLGGPYLQGGHDRDFPILDATSCNIPSGAQAYSLNFTAVPRGPLGYMTVWPAGQARPTVSTLNSITGVVVANAAIVRGGDGGDVSVYATNDIDLVIDINGYFAAPGQGGLSLYTVAPCRVLDTRNGNGQFVGRLPVNVVGSVCAPSNTAQAYVLNATVVPAGPLGYLTLWPDCEGRPGVSTLNAIDGAITSNMAIVPTNNGSIDAFATNPTQLILDISSYFGP